MPRASLSAVILAGLAMMSLPVTPVLAAQALDGWNGYKFGLSPDAARAVPGMSFGPYSAKNLMNEDVGAMAAQKDALLNGRAYKLNLFFNAAQKLNEISLENQVAASRLDCEKLFLDLMTLLEKTYGGFLAVNPQRQRSDADTPPVSLVWKKQGASSYQLSTVFLDGETASAWKARHVQGGNYADIAATWSGKTDDTQAPCLTDIDFNGR